VIFFNIGDDRLDYWKNREALIEGFRQFAAKVSSVLWWCADDPILTSLSLKDRSYGFSDKADLRILQWRQEGFNLLFDLSFQETLYSNLELPLIGEHNAANAAAVFGLALELGIPHETIRRAFKSFKGVKRRLEKKGERRAVSLYDDYAHHPTEIKTTLKGLRRAIGEKRLVVAFQPHRYTRVRDCWNEFISSFEEADVLFMTDIWSAGEAPIAGYDVQKLYQEIKAANPIPVIYEPRSTFSSAIAAFLRPHDVVVTLGAGDVTDVCGEILEHEISTFRLALCQGGKSAEHEVSLRSAKVVMEHLNPDYYTLQLFTITKEGEWLIGGQKKELPAVVQELLACDAVFPALHGAFSEDGMLQGFFETIGIPYAGADYRSCAVCMDKAWTKHIVARHGVEIARFIEFTIYDWEQNPAATLQTMMKQFAFPFYIKPVHLGSTFGVHRVKNESEVHAALEAIRRLDYRFIVEEEIVGREMEFGFIGNFEASVSDPAEVIRADEIHTYENKYSAKGMPSIPKVALPPEVIAQGREIAKTVYHAVGCTGFARIDFFLKPDNTWVLNEINPIPGCTPTSVYPLIWKAEGVPFTEVIDRIIIAGLHRQRYYDRRLRPPPKPPIQL
jgi:UDP-N-acetylmuramate--alanine ligase